MNQTMFRWIFGSCMVVNLMFLIAAPTSLSRMPFYCALTTIAILWILTECGK